MIHMRQFNAFEERNVSFLVGKRVEYATIQVTETGLKKSIMDATAPVRAYLKEKGIHDEKASVDRPEKELKGFSKVYLQPGESKDVAITIDAKALSFYDESLAKWTAEKGAFVALVGNSCDNIKLKTKFYLK